MATQLPITVGSPTGSVDLTPRRSVWYRYPSPGPLGVPGGWQTTSRWTVEDLLSEGFEVYSPSAGKE
jgi:hypothetical protein